MSILEALNNVTPQDLAEVDAKIEQLNQELLSLRAARQFIAGRLSGVRDSKPGEFPLMRVQYPEKAGLPFGGVVPSKHEVTVARQPANRIDKRTDKLPAKEMATQAEARREELRAKIYDLIASEGQMPVFAIAERLGETSQMIGVTVARCEWFVRTTENDIAIAKAKG